MDIKAPAATVWRHLIDFSSYPQWNPLITSAGGDPAVGGRLQVTISLPEARPMRFRPVVTRCEPNFELRWFGKLAGVPFLFDGEHCFRIEEKGRGVVRFVQTENFRGVLVPFVWKSMSSSARAGFERMNFALKRRSEDGLQNPGG